MANRWQQHETCDVSALAKPLEFNFSRRVAKNRFMKSAMAESLASWSPDDPEHIGIATEEYVNVYRRFGEGDWGVIVTGQIDIDARLYNRGNIVIGKEHQPIPGDLRFERLKQVAAAATAHGSLILGQIVHVGRQLDARVSAETISASPTPLEPKLGMSFAKPREATKADLSDVIESFAHAAWYLEQAGFSGIQLHAAHGFLLSAFLSPSTNHRTDEYGGNLHNRTRLSLEVMRAIKARVSPSFILGIKVNSTEFQENGFTADDGVVLCKALTDDQFDFIELTGGTFEVLHFQKKALSTTTREGFFLEFAKSITPVLHKTRSYTSGGFRTSSGMVSTVTTVDGVGLARAAAQEPSLPRDLLSGSIKAAIRPITPFLETHHMSLALAGSQIREIGMGRDPPDSSDYEKVQGALKQLQVWTKTEVGNRHGIGWLKLDT
ncbi:NADH oxidase [Fusarium tjaetaba]|uniref:NADH oxidase n=1 Tax=Fusarium tjaetaba TaxID=1567544 RepID=A0A8H5Q8L6_9HYPO|nr:NADH oxidase [Fusarium tjaetaba]KAF5610875.1 NADH oxidase [Fusarium tjaetaba]